MNTHQIKLRKKNQMTLPVSVSKYLGIDEGDTVYLQKENNKYVLITAEDIIDPTAGALAKYAKGKPPVTQEAMDRAVDEGILESWNRFVEETEEEYDK